MQQMKFEKYRRPNYTPISEFINQFERLLNKTKQYEHVIRYFSMPFIKRS